VTLIDVSAGLGAYAFRRLRHETVDGLLALMDRNGIDHAVVSSNPSILYRDAHSGNEQLNQAMADAPRGRLTGIATINPLYAGWREDATTAVRQWGFKGIRLLPNYHGYKLSDHDGQAALDLIEELNVPVVLPQRIEDRRQQHAWDQAADLTFDDLAVNLAKRAGIKALLLNWLDVNEHAVRDTGMRGRLLIDINRFDVSLYNQLEKLIAALGVEHFAFGSHMPFNYVGPALLRLEVLRLNDDDKQRIAWRNAVKFLGLAIGNPLLTP
jgi:predicted TIM-barrel fold metal-dependent hydrolase